MNINPLPVDTDLADGFWCSYRLSKCLKDFHYPNAPWIGQKIHSDAYLSDDSALLVENGKIIKLFEIDWD